MSADALVVPAASDMRMLGEVIGGACTGGDVIVLDGDLGAGKTTFTQGLARGLGITDAITSPTFVIARGHAHPADGVGLVHVDAYRLGSVLELDDLDLDSDLASSVVVVEWGGGIADRLSPDRLVVRIARSDDEADDTRHVVLEPHGDRWTSVVHVLAGEWRA